jgi:uncharacterized protein
VTKGGGLPGDEGVCDDVEHGRFLLRTGAGEAELAYRAGDGRLVLVHTGVPEAVRRRGIADRLMQAAVHRAARTGEVIVPWCSYARRWLAERPDVTADLAVDWTPPGRP